MISLTRSLALALALSLALPAGPALAQPSAAADAEASVHFRRGVELFQDGDLQAALVEFRRAYELAPNYKVLFNIGQVTFQLQDYPGALDALGRYLKEGGAQIPASRRADVERDLEKLRDRVASVQITSSLAEVEVSVDDVPAGKTPMARPILVGVGRHRVTASKEGFAPVTRVVEVASGDARSLTLDPVELPRPPGAPPPLAVPRGPAPPAAWMPLRSGLPPAPPTTAPGRRGALWAGWGLTAALAGGSGVCGGLALRASSDLQAMRASAAATRSSLDAAHDRTVYLALATDLLGGAALVSGGVSLYLTLRRPTASEAGPRSSGLRLTGPAEGAPSAGLRVAADPAGVRVLGSF